MPSGAGDEWIFDREGGRELSGGTLSNSTRNHSPSLAKVDGLLAATRRRFRIEHGATAASHH